MIIEKAISVISIPSSKIYLNRQLVGARVLDQALKVSHNLVSLASKRLAVPVEQVLNVGEVLALEGPGEDAGRQTGGLLSLVERLQYYIS